MNFSRKKILIIGMGKSGMACAKFLAQQGAKISIYDKKPKEHFQKEINELGGLDIAFYLSVEPTISKDEFDLLIVSPGVSLNIELIKMSQQAGIPIWGELELAYRLNKAHIIAVTGTNGKTTTTSLIGEILKTAGLDVKVAGNIGIPLIQETTLAQETSYLVVEVSSFQLETTIKFKSEVAILLNITPDHLDRHQTLENYATIKSKIFENQNADDFAVLNYDDVLVRKMRSKIKGKVIFFSQKHKLKAGVFFDEGKIKYSWQGETGCISMWEECSLKGAHNIENAMASVAVALVLGVDKAMIKKGLENFAGVPHRLEVIGQSEGVIYVNDSKGTNPEATIKALEAYADKNIILIAGGMDKKSSFEELAGVLSESRAKLIVFGETAEQIIDTANASGVLEYYRVNNLEEAVFKAKEIATNDSVVLFSPACASWDMYKNFEERGEHFRKLVRNLMGCK